MISGCNAHQDEEAQRADAGTANLGFYFPLRENTRRFESAKARKQSSN
jgi:hypothetical protein